MLGHLGGVLLVSFLLVREKRYISLMSLLFMMLTAAVHFGVPFV